MYRPVRCADRFTFCEGRPSDDNPVDENSVRFSECPRQSSASRRLEVTTRNADGIECEVTRLLFEEGTTLSDADTISDNNYIFMSLTVTAPHFTADMWSSVRDKLLRMVQLSNVRGVGQLSEIAQMYKVVVETPVQGDGSLRHVWQTLHSRGLQVVQSAMHKEGDSLTERHPVLSFAESCDICDAHTEEIASGHSHLRFLVCDLLHLLPLSAPELEIENIVRESCTTAGLEPRHLAVSVVEEAETQTPNGAALSPPTPHLCWQRPATNTWGASKCPLSHFGCGGDGRRKFVSHALPAAITKGTDIFVDDTMGGSTCTCIEIQCTDRKGLVLDILWALHSLQVSLVQSRINHTGLSHAPCPRSKIFVQLFLKDRSTRLVLDEARLRFVLEQLHRAITLPVSVTVVPGVSDSLEVLVFGLLGPGSRGRPCVTRDVTKVMQQESLKMLAAFVGILDDQAVQENLPGEALHGLEGNLMFPLLQRHNAVAVLPPWDDVEDNDGLLLNTARDTCSNCSPRAPSTAEGRGLRCITVPEFSARDGSPQQAEVFCQSSSCDASSVDTTPDHRDIPILRDLEQHAYCPFLEDDVPLTRTQTPKSLSFMRKSSLPRGLLSTGLQEKESGSTVAPRSQHDSGHKKRVPVESMLSFFGEESIPHSHVSTGCRHLVELHHFVVQLGEGAEQGVAAAASRLKHILEQTLSTVSCEERCAAVEVV